MRLFDGLRQSLDAIRGEISQLGSATDPELQTRVGRLEAEVERLDLSWHSYRDELRRLVARLEKRDQRARERAEREIEPEPIPSVDRITEKVLERRNHAIRGVQ